MSLRAAASRIDGFSLVEMLVVLVILALGTSLGAMSIHSILPGQRLDAAAAALDNELRLLRAEGMRTSRPLQLQLNADVPRFVSSRPGAPDLSMRGLRATMETSVESRGGTDAIRFMPNGTTTGGRLVIAGNAGMHAFAISRFTGAIRHTAGAP